VSAWLLAVGVCKAELHRLGPRALQVLLYSAHWSACVFYWLARVQGLTRRTWIGYHVELLMRATTIQRCACACSST